MKRTLILMLALCMLLPVLGVGCACAEGAYSVENLDQAVADAESGNYDAMIFLGNLYYLGAYNNGIARDFSKALDWFLKAAPSGDPDILYTIARLYERGSAGEKNMEKAYEWYNKAAEAGNADAKERAESDVFKSIRWKQSATELTGTLGEDVMIVNRSAMPLYLDNPVVDCDMLTLEMSIVEVKNGWPYGRYALYAMGLDGKWQLVDYFQIEKFQADGSPRTYDFTLAEPISFKALGVTLAEKGMEFGLFHSDKYYVGKECVSSYSDTITPAEFTPSGAEYPFLSSRVSYSAYTNPWG